MTYLNLRTELTLLTVILLLLTACSSSSYSTADGPQTGTLVGSGTGGVVDYKSGASNQSEEEKTHEEKVKTQQAIIDEQNKIIEKQKQEILLLKRQQFHNESLKRYE